MHRAAHPTCAEMHRDVLPDEILCRESQNDEELRNQLTGGVVPAVDTIYR